jgi:hypothetical protein
MRWNECPELFVETIAAHQLFLRMGYAPDSLATVIVEETGEVGVVLREPEGEMCVQVGIFDGPPGALYMAWHQILDLANACTDFELSELEGRLQDSTVFDQAPEILVAMSDAGIPIRRPLREELELN